MRLRSSQFVFLLLLVCSVQSREEYTLHLGTDAVAGQTGHASQHHERASAVADRNCPAPPAADRHIRETRLDAASVAAEKIPWSMSRSALASAAISSFTGFHRA